MPTCSLDPDPITNVTRPLKIVSVVDAKGSYFEEFFNWLTNFYRICGSLANVYLVCFGPKAAELLPKYGLRCDSITGEPFAYHRDAPLSMTFFKHMGDGLLKNGLGGRGEVWKLRWEVLQKLVDDGNDILVSDSDAVWKENPFPTLNKYAGYEVMSQSGTGPPIAKNAWGSTFCVGFMYIQSSSATKAMMSYVAKDMAAGSLRMWEPVGDQISINKWYLQKGLKFTSLESSQLKLQSNENPIESHGEMLGSYSYMGETKKVVLLPDSEFVRDCVEHNVCPENKHPKIAHCQSHNMSAYGPLLFGEKTKIMKMHGLWGLREDWASVPPPGPTGDVLAYLQAISLPMKVAK